MGSRRCGTTPGTESTREIQITVTGRKSGRQITIPVWFVEEGEERYLLPVRGSDADWCRNLLKNPTIRVAAGGAERQGCRGLLLEAGRHRRGSPHLSTRWLLALDIGLLLTA